MKYKGTPCSLFLVPCSLFLVPCSLFLVPCPCILVPVSLYNLQHKIHHKDNIMMQICSEIDICEMKKRKEQCEVSAVLNQFPIFFEKSDRIIIGCNITNKEHQ